MTDNSKFLIDFIQKTFPISDYAAKLIADNFEPVHYDKQTFVLKEGKINNHYVFLYSGFMRCFTYDFDGNEVTTNFFLQTKWYLKFHLISNANHPKKIFKP